MFSRRSRNVVGPAIALAVAGVAAGALAAIVLRRRRRARGAPMENAKHIVKRLFEEPWTGNFEAIDEFISPNYVGHDPAVPEPIVVPRECGTTSRGTSRASPAARSRSTSRSPRATRSQPLDGSRDAHGRARRNLPDREGRHGLGAHDLALRGREGRRGVDDLGHARDARPAGPDPRARSRVTVSRKRAERTAGRRSSALPLQGLRALRRIHLAADRRCRASSPPSTCRVPSAEPRCA